MAGKTVFRRLWQLRAWCMYMTVTATDSLSTLKTLSLALAA